MLAAAAIEGLIWLVVIAFLIYGPWQHYCNDSARQDLFMKRAALFDIAQDGRIDFNDPAYRALRHHIEGMIRFAHHVNWMHMVLFVSVAPRRVDGDGSDVRALIAALPAGRLKSDMWAIYASAGHRMIRMMVRKSPALTILAFVFPWSLKVARLAAGMSNRSFAFLDRAAQQQRRLAERLEATIRAEAEAAQI